MKVYGLVTIGVPEIDLDHVNIDQYLSFALEAGFDQESFANLCQALISHFKKEEKICAEQKLRMSDVHLEEHGRLTKVINSLSFGEKSEEEWLLFFKQVLQDHVQEYDKTITT